MLKVMPTRPKVTVYIPSHQYGRFLRECLESVLAQTLTDWEIILIDDASTDETAAIMAEYAGSLPDKIRLVRNHEPRGLQYNANLALEMARAEYIMRLDADDYLDENALLVMAAYLDQNPDVALVYPNYIYVDENGVFLGIENRKKLHKEARLLDLPAHGACTMVRRRILKTIGGYNEQYTAQDGHELWLKVVNRYPIGNVTTPLFFYRQHNTSLSRNEDRILTARQQIKRDLVEKHEGTVQPRIVVILPAKNTYPQLPNVVLNPLAGRPLIDYSLANAAALSSSVVTYVTTDDERVVAYCQDIPNVIAEMRSLELSQPQVRLSEVIAYAVQRLEETHHIYPDILVVLSLHSPLCRPVYIQQAIDTLLLYNVDSVLSIYEDLDVHFAHGSLGLEPLNRNMLQRLRLEREALFVDNGAIRVFWRDSVKAGDFYGQKVGHVVMPRHESYQIKTAFDLWLIEQILLKQQMTEKES